ncbi:ADP-ribosylglycohydrolase family protein [Candidatus Dependentiae bacterium]
MRLSPVCTVAGTDDKLARDLAFKQTVLTHGGPAAMYTNMLLAHIITKAIDRDEKTTKEDFLGLSSFTLPDTDTMKSKLNDVGIAEQSVDFSGYAKAKAQAIAIKDSTGEWDWKTATEDKITTEEFYGSFSHKSPKLSPHCSLHTSGCLKAALWAFYHGNSFEDVVLKAANLGGDADTVAAVAGQIAGAFYGYEAIPEKWRTKLYKGEEIRGIAEQLYNLGQMTPEQRLSFEPKIKDLNPKSKLSDEGLSQKLDCTHAEAVKIATGQLPKPSSSKTKSKTSFCKRAWFTTTAAGTFFSLYFAAKLYVKIKKAYNAYLDNFRQQCLNETPLTFLTYAKRYIYKKNKKGEILLFSSAAVLTLGIGMGLKTAISSHST